MCPLFLCQYRRGFSKFVWILKKKTYEKPDFLLFSEGFDFWTWLSTGLKRFWYTSEFQSAVFHRFKTVLRNFELRMVIFNRFKTVFWKTVYDRIRWIFQSFNFPPVLRRKRSGGKRAVYGHNPDKHYFKKRLVNDF